MISLQEYQEAGKKLEEIFSLTEKEVRVNMNLLELENIIDTIIQDLGCVSATKGYKKYNYSSCLCVDYSTGHCIPREYIYVLPESILTVDIAVSYKGVNVDKAVTYCKSPTENQKKLLIAGEQIKDQAIRNLLLFPSWRSWVDELHKIIEKENLYIMEMFGGHGIGKKLHEPPSIWHFYEENDKDFNFPLNQGLAIEPMLSTTDEYWHSMAIGEIVMKNRHFSVHYEDTVFITENKIYNVTNSRFIG